MLIFVDTNGCLWICVDVCGYVLMSVDICVDVCGYVLMSVDMC